jgi:phosphoribosylformylglycinamidine synthase
MAEGAPRALVITGYGINCDYETAAACETAGFRVERVHVNDVIESGVRAAGSGASVPATGGARSTARGGSPGPLGRYQLVVFPGGFSFGDDLGSGVAFALKVRFAAAGGGERFRDLLLEFRERGGLILGICNGFQILARLGLVPAVEGRFDQQVTIAPNDNWYFIDRWVRMRVEPGSPCVFTRGLEGLLLRMPVRHGEGKLLPADDGVMRAMERGGRVALRYCGPRGKPTMAFPDNPNGSVRAVAGVCDDTGRVFGLMPHPEAAVSVFQYPDWTGLRSGCGAGAEDASGRARHGAPGDRGDGFRLFENARRYLA